MSAAARRRRPEPGTTGSLHPAGTKLVPAARSARRFDEMARRLALGEYLQVRDLIYQGDAFGLPAGTPAIFLEGTLASSRVRMTGGPHAGATAWVAAGAFRPSGGAADPVAAERAAAGEETRAGSTNSMKHGEPRQRRP
jgi:hypothetical protein